MPRRRSKRALSIIGTLLIGTLLVTLAFTTAAMSFSHFTLSNQMDKASVARSLAEAAANRAIARCLADIRYGTKNNLTEDIEVRLASAPDGWGKVYFGGHDSVAFGNIPRSNNFLAQDQPCQSTGRVVPSRSLHVIAYGQFGVTRRAVETIVAIPQYKYAIASSGNVTSNGGLLVAGVKNPAAVEGGVSLIPDDQWAPGCLMSNSVDPTAALDLDSGSQSTRITGDVRAVGGIKLGSNTTVEGAFKAFASPEDIPTVKASDFDTASTTGVNTSLASNEFHLEINGPARRSGDLTVTGGLNMDAGILYVDGDVEVHGGLHGKGALISTGKVKVFNQAQFKAADDQAAIVAQSDVEIHGSDKDDCVYNGVVFTQGDFKASDVTLLGSLCAAKSDGSKVQLDNVNMLSNPMSMDLNYSIEGPLPEDIATARRYWNDSGTPGGFDQTEPDITKRKLVVDPKDQPVVGAASQDYQVGTAGDRYDSASWLMAFPTSPDYENAVKAAYGRSSASQQYNLLPGDSTYCRYNSDYTSGYDPAANNGGGGFTVEKWSQNNPLGLLDGNAEVHLNEIAYQGKPGWEFADDFSFRDLYKATRGQQTSAEPVQKYKLVNKQTGETQYVTFAQVFSPNEDPAVYGRRAAYSLIQTAWEGHFPLWEATDTSWVRQSPMPIEPWNDSRRPQKLSSNFLFGGEVMRRWLAAQTNFNKVPTKGGWRFNPLQFVQLRDQSQRLLWREYTPDETTDPGCLVGTHPSAYGRRPGSQSPIRSQASAAGRGW